MTPLISLKPSNKNLSRTSGGSQMTKIRFVTFNNRSKFTLKQGRQHYSLKIRILRRQLAVRTIL